MRTGHLRWLWVLLSACAALPAQTLNFNSPQAAAYFYQDVDFSLAADLNGDGRPDLVVGSYGPVTVMLNNGDGTFRSLPPIVIDNYSGAGMALGDFNGDGKLDVVLAAEFYVVILLG